MVWQFFHILRNKKGANSIEYSLVATLIGIAIIAALWSVRTQVVGLYTVILAAFS